MSKSFKTSPKPASQPTAEQIAAFERGGVGTDSPQPTLVDTPKPTKEAAVTAPAEVGVSPAAAPAAPEPDRPLYDSAPYASYRAPAPVSRAPHRPAAPAPEPAAEPVKRLSIDLPASMHTRFKTACSATNSKMAAEIIDFIERRTRELEIRAGLIR